MGIDQIPRSIRARFEVREWKHAVAILKNDFPCEWQDLMDLLGNFTIPVEWIMQAGGNKSPIADSVDSFLCAKRGWREKKFETGVKVDGVETDTPTHKVDCFKNGVAVELEWNNKDPFFDRDLNNFRLLFDLRAVSVGVIITRCDELQEVFNAVGKGSSYGNSTTHMGKLIPRIEGGGGAGCPILVFGIGKSCISGGPHV